MIRIVLDTNVLVSALLTSHGVPAQLLSLCLSDSDLQLCISAHIYAEYEEVLHRPKFNRSAYQVTQVLVAITRSPIWVTPKRTVRACLDPDDDIFLECAQEANAHFLVTGNVRHYPATWNETQVITPRQLLDASL